MIASPPVVVCATCAVSSVEAALRDAGPGTTIVVDGVVRGRAVVRVPNVAIAGRPGAALVSPGTTVLDVEAPGVRIAGLTIRGGGADPDGKQAAVLIRAPRATLASLRVLDAPFGVSLFGAHGTRLRDVAIAGLGTTRPEIAGDAFRAWGSNGVTLERVTIRDGRDVLLSYCDRLTIRDSAVVGGRYGIHDMYSPHLRLERVRVAGAEIGLNLMYADAPEIAHSVFQGAGGPAGYGLALEGVTNARIHDDAFVDDRVGLAVLDSAAGADVAIERNVFAHDGTALSAETATGGVVVRGNAFVDNLEQVAATGGGTLAGIAWDGNAWNDYAGYDRDGDGRGDVPYAPRDAYEALADRRPALRVFAGSPAARAIAFAARAFPAFAAPPKLVDRRPLMRAAIPAGLPAAPSPSAPLAWGLAALFAAPFAMLGVPRRRRARGGARAPLAAVPGVPAIALRGVTKAYGAERGIFDASLVVAPGESVALWGANGAGKTTLMRCVLGQVRHAGEIEIFGRRCDADRPAARALAGYAPQHLPEVETDAAALVALVAALRGVADAGTALARLGIAGAARSAVGALSGGTRQRLALALALVGDPPLLVLDEPSAGLDRAGRRAALALLQAEKARGTTLLFTSHLIDDVRALADRVVRIENGRIVEIVGREQFLREEAA